MGLRTRVVALWMTALIGLAAPFHSTAQPASAAAPDTYVLVRCGRVLAHPGAAGPESGVRTNITLVVKNGLLDSIVDGLSGPDLSAATAKGATVTEVDLKDRFVMPGFIDCHVHLTNVWNETNRIRQVSESDGFIAIRATTYAKATLDAGFTTVRDLGGKGSAPFAVRDAINAGLVPGPRILAAGEAISITGGHGDETLGYRSDLYPVPGPDQGIADGESECMKAVRSQVKMGADVIKLMATGGVLSASASGLAQHFTDQELAAIVKTAHSLGRRVAAHAHGTDGINAALRAGVDSIEHGTYQDAESLRLLKEHGSFYVPTLLAADTVGRNAEIPGYYLPMVASKARLVKDKVVESFKKAHEAGVKIAFGTDSGVSPHGQNAREFGLMIQGGMTPLEAITAATVTAADLCNLSTQLGTLEPGKEADIVGVRGDPLRDGAALERIDFVMRHGVVYKNATK